MAACSPYGVHAAFRPRVVQKRFGFDSHLHRFSNSSKTQEKIIGGNFSGCSESIAWWHETMSPPVANLHLTPQWTAAA